MSKAVFVGTNQPDSLGSEIDIAPAERQDQADALAVFFQIPTKKPTPHQNLTFPRRTSGE